MGKIFQPSSRGNVLFQALAVYTWLTVLSPLSVTDGYYSVYLLCAAVGFLCLCDNYRRGIHASRSLDLLGVLFSLAVAAANYPLYTPLSVLQNLFDLGCLLLGGYVVGSQILAWMAEHLPLAPAPGLRRHPGRVFTLSFMTIAAVDLGFLFFVRYPGVLTTDSFSTIGQIMGTESYNNVMPFWHTIAAKAFIKPGMALFGDINAGVAAFHVAQILFMSACMAAAVTTLYQAGAHGVLVLGVLAMYAFLPHNIVYSVTLWKDIPFAGAALLMVTALYRLMRDMGNAVWLNYAAFLLGTLGFCLLRTNGWYSFAVMLLIMVLCLRKEHPGLLLMMAGVCLLCWLLIGPVLDLWGVKESNPVEAFAVPMQQIGRVIWEERPMSQEDAQLLSKLFLLDRVRELYDPHNVDPIKYFTFQRANIPYLLEHLGEYLSLYFRLGIQYPADYFHAWVEQTKGYWNGGYFYYTYTLGLGENSFGIYQIPGDNMLARCYAALMRYLEKPEILQWTVSIGLHSWVLTACTGVMARQRRREYVLAVPLLVLIVGLCLGTPVYAEFRYAYPMILCAPLILGLTLYSQKEKGLSH